MNTLFNKQKALFEVYNEISVVWVGKWRINDNNAGDFGECRTNEKKQADWHSHEVGIIYYVYVENSDKHG